MFSEWIESISLIYFSIVSRSLYVAMVLVVVIISLKSKQIKSATVFDLMFLSNLLMLAICSLDLVRIFDIFSKFIETIIWWCEKPFVVMLSLGLDLSWSLIFLWTFLIFLAKRLEKFSFRLRISFTLELATLAYDDVFG